MNLKKQQHVVVYAQFHLLIFHLCRRQKTMQVDATVFTCISMLSRAMGPSIQPDIKELLEPMLAVGLR